MTTLFVLGFGAMAMLALAGLAMAWATLRVVLWVVFLPLMLLKALFGLVFGAVFGTLGLVLGGLGLVFGLLVALVVGGTPAAAAPARRRRGLAGREGHHGARGCVTPVWRPRCASTGETSGAPSTPRGGGAPSHPSSRTTRARAR
jgi:hypothetical protein